MNDENKELDALEEEFMVLEPDSDVLRMLSAQDFAAFGLQDLAYVKVIKTDSGQNYAVHAADGTQLLRTKKRLEAVFAIEDHRLVPVSVH